jgi:hypothetical protein
VSIGLPCGPCTPGLVTRGFIADTIITKGLGECPKTPIQRAVEAARRLIRGKGKQLQKVIVSARLLAINDEEIVKRIQGSEVITFYEEERWSGPRVIAKWISGVVKNTVDRIVITANRIFGLDED